MKPFLAFVTALALTRLHRGLQAIEALTDRLNKYLVQGVICVRVAGGHQYGLQQDQSLAILALLDHLEGIPCVSCHYGVDGKGCLVTGHLDSF